MSTTTDTSSMDPRAKRWGTAVKWLAMIFGFAFLAPVVFMAIGGLIGTAAFVGIYVGTWMLRPWFFMKAANLRLKLIKHEAATNPVETLTEEHRRQTVLLNERMKGVEVMAGAIKTLDQTIDELVREFPDSPEIPQLRADQSELEALHKSREQDWQDAYVSLGEFAKEIKRVGRLWDVSQAAAKARQQSGLSEDEWMGKLKTQTSIDAIRTHLNTQLSALSTERMQAEADRILKGKTAAKALPAATAPIDISAVPAAQPVKVAR